jgi:hypothetical protein
MFSRTLFIIAVAQAAKLRQRATETSARKVISECLEAAHIGIDEEHTSLKTQKAL